MRQDNQSTTPTLAECIQTVVDANLINLHTCLPAKIVSYDPSTQMASVQIQLMYSLENGKAFPWPVIPNVPVKHPRAQGGKAFIHLPLSSGDDVMLIFSERSLDNWKTKGGLTDPKDRRKFDISDCYALVGGSALPDAFSVTDPNAIELVNRSSQMQLLPSGMIHLGSFSPTHPVGLADLITARIEAIESALSQLISVFNEHDHLAPPNWAPTAAPRWGASSYSPPADNLGSTKVMVVT